MDLRRWRGVQLVKRAPADHEAVQRWSREVVPTLPAATINELFEELLANDGSVIDDYAQRVYPKGAPLPSLSRSSAAPIPVLAMQRWARRSKNSCDAVKNKLIWIDNLALWIVVASGFSLYLDSFANYSATYAGLAGIMTALIFLYLMAAILVFGAQYNAAKEKADVVRDPE